MKISIITVCRNSENTIENTICSVLAQTYSNVEYLVIDGASTDNTLQIIEKYQNKISRIISEPDNGIYDAMNKGIKASTGDYLFFLNADDVFVDENVLENIANELITSGKELVYGDIIVKDNFKGTTFLKKHNKLNKIYLLKNTPCQPGTFYKREVFDKYGLFDINYKIASDHEWFLRAFLKHKITAKYVSLPITIFNIGGISSNSENNMNLIKERNEIIDTYFTPFERKSYEIISKYFRSLTNYLITSLLLDKIFKFSLDN